MTASIEASGVAKVFGNGQQQTLALRDVTLEVQEREFVSIIGPSGCGKSTLLRLIGDLLPPSAGTLKVRGKSPRQARLARDYGVVFQSPVLYDWRTVERNVHLPLELMDCPFDERRRRTEQMLELVGLSEFRRHYPWQLSGGMQQRVAIARALSFSPSILLMDEPFGALDELTRERMNMELQRIWMDTHTTVVFITHSISEAVFLSDRVFVMSPRPGTIELVRDIPLPRPRTEETRRSEAFFHVVTEIRGRLRE